jgi:hypothetical protein
MASPDSHNCTTCGEPAKQRCSKCSESVDRDGNAAPTYYCSTTCQRADCKKHKVLCRQSNARKQLFRGGEFLQKIFYALRQTLFDTEVLDVKLEGNKIHVYETFEPKERIPFPIFPFPEDVALGETDKTAMLSFLACTDAVVLLNGITEKAIEGEDMCNNKKFDQHTDMPGICNLEANAADLNFYVNKTQCRIVRYKPYGIDDTLCSRSYNG